MDFLKIDGAFGEGGGQIIRTSVALSCITKKPVIIENIRKNRRSPGLKAQHITAIRILQKICGAEVEGAHMGSQELCFIPRDVRGGNLEEHVGTAGSVSLVLQAVIPVMAVSKGRLELKITGGTDVSWSPTFDYMQHVVRETYARMGLKFSISLDKRGYYPKGGGQVTLKADPQKISPVRLLERSTRLVKVNCTYSKIPERTIREAVENITSRLTEKHYTTSQQIREEDALDAGAAVLVHMEDANSVLGTDALFDKKTGNFAKLGKIDENKLGVDENLADMIVVPASVASGMSIFRVPNITKHLETNLFVASSITGCKYGVGRVDGGYEIRVEGTSDSGIH